MFTLHCKQLQLLSILYSANSWPQCQSHRIWRQSWKPKLATLKGKKDLYMLHGQMSKIIIWLRVHKSLTRHVGLFHLQKTYIILVLMIMFNYNLQLMCTQFFSLLILQVEEATQSVTQSENNSKTSRFLVGSMTGSGNASTASGEDSD